MKRVLAVCALCLAVAAPSQAALTLVPSPTPVTGTVAATFSISLPSVALTKATTVTVTCTVTVSAPGDSLSPTEIITVPGAVAAGNASATCSASLPYSITVNSRTSALIFNYSVEAVGTANGATVFDRISRGNRQPFVIPAAGTTTSFTPAVTL